MLLLATIHTLAGLLIAGLSLPLILGRVPPNRWYGFRTPRTLSDASVWYPANAYSGRWLLGCGLVIAAAAVILTQVPGMSVEVYGWSMLAVIVVGVGTSMVQSFRFLSKLGDGTPSA
jgi:uncharacterized membrane protein